MPIVGSRPFFFFWWSCYGWLCLQSSFVGVVDESKSFLEHWYINKKFEWLRLEKGKMGSLFILMYLFLLPSSITSHSLIRSLPNDKGKGKDTLSLGRWPAEGPRWYISDSFFRCHNNLLVWIAKHLLKQPSTRVRVTHTTAQIEIWIIHDLVLRWEGEGG